MFSPIICTIAKYNMLLGSLYCDASGDGGRPSPLSNTTLPDSTRLNLA